MVPQQHTDQVLVPARGEPPRVRRRPVPVGVEAPSTVVDGDTLIAGEVLVPGWSLRSASGEFGALMRRDGNLVIQRCRDHALVWQAGTGGSSAAVLEMRDDGDLCVVAPTGAKEWSSGTSGKPGAFAQLGDDGVLVVCSFYRERVWSTAGRPVAGRVGGQAASR